MFRPSHLNLTLPKVATLTCILAAAALAQQLTPPNAHWSMAFNTDPKGQLTYSVLNGQGRAIIQPSALHLNLKDQPPLGAQVNIANYTPGQHDATYHRLTGKASTIRDQYNSLIVETVDPT